MNGTDLTIDQKKVAARMRASRPMCYPGTDNIIELDRAREWLADVARQGTAAGIRDIQRDTFFDACGVAK